MRLLLILLFCCLGRFLAFAQEDPLREKMGWYDQSQPYSQLFVHFDKNVYANNETIWFTGYLLKSNLKQNYHHKILSVALVRAVDSAIVMQGKYLMDKGLALGSMLLPDSLLTGNYYLVSSTNFTINGKPLALFVQPITIKTNIEPKFKTDMKLLPGSGQATKEHQLLLAVTSREGFFLPQPAHISYKYGKIFKTANTDASGQLLIHLPQQSNLEDPNVYVKLKYQKDSTFINMPLPQPKAKAHVKFYPEGGQLVNGLPSRIGWEVKDQQNRPMALKAFLFKDNEVIDTIETGSYGIGEFKLLPNQHSRYSVKLAHSSLADSIYVLPQPVDNGLVMTINHAVVGDTLKLNLISNAARKFTIRVHNFRETFLYVPFDMEYHKRTLKIPLAEIPKGLQILTITDSLDRPIAERTFFAHYDITEKVAIATDQAIYKQREKVNLKLELKPTEEQAIISIACVQDNRLELKKMTDIESYSYLNKELASFPLHNKGNGYRDQTYIEQLLLVKGWRRYTWQDLQAVKAKDTLQQADSLKISGYVTKNNKQLSKEVAIGMFGNDKINLTTTSIKGNFEFNVEDLIVEPEKKLYLFVNEKNKLPFSFHFNDDFNNVNRQLARNLPVENIIMPSTLVNNTELLLSNNEKVTRLKEIVVTTKNDNQFNYGVNSCGDYVCQYNILNCVNHIGDSHNTKPVKGMMYTVNGSNLSSGFYQTNTKGMVVYPGCDEVNPAFFKINPVYLHKEFYLSDYSEPQEPAFFSTIYWNYATLLTKGKTTELSFYTSDITGKFRIIVQGISNKDVIYAEKFFEVK